MDPDLQIKLYKVREAKAKAEASEVLLQTAQMSVMPHRNLPISVFRDGGHWVCLLESHDESLKCVQAYGDCPMQACLNFDNLWLGIGVELEDPEEEF